MDLKISEKYLPTIFTYHDFATPFEAKINKKEKNLQEQWYTIELLWPMDMSSITQIFAPRLQSNCK